MDEESVSRRQFFKGGLDKTAQASMELLAQRAEQKARGWIRPPFAKPELDFLLACTRCDACIEACPHQVIFPLPFSRGAEVATTPALDLLNKGCHLCDDWPCVQVCEVDALVFPAPLPVEDKKQEQKQEQEQAEAECDEPEALLPASLAKAMIDTSSCLPYNGPECGACKGSCPVEGALLWQGDKPIIDEDHCVGCALCREACIVDPKAVLISK